MSLKRVFVLLVVLAIGLSCAFANQGTYRVTSDEVQTFRAIKRLSGRAMPEPTYPVTGDQLLLLLAEIDVDSLPSSAQSLYKDLVETLSNPDKDALFQIDDELSADVKLEVGSQVRTQKSTDELTFSQLYKRVSEAVNVDYFQTNAWAKYAAAHFDLGITPGFSKESINESFAFEIIKMEEVMPLSAWASVGNGRLNF